MGGVVQVACQNFLVREACVSVMVDGAGFLLCMLGFRERSRGEGNQQESKEEEG